MTMYMIRNPLDEIAYGGLGLELRGGGYSPYEGCGYGYGRCQPYYGARHVSRNASLVPRLPWEGSMPRVRYGGEVESLMHAMSRIFDDEEQYEDDEEEEEEDSEEEEEEAQAQMLYAIAKALEKEQKREEKKQRKQAKKQQRREARRQQRALQTIEKAQETQEEEEKEMSEDNSEADWSLSKDGSSYEWRLPIAAQSTVSNVALQLTRNVQEPSHRVLQVTVDTEHREEVALFGSWPMVSVSQQTVTRRVSLPEDAKTEGMTVTLEESNELQGGGDRTLLVKVPRQQAESIESAQPAENVADSSDNHTDSATVSDNSVHASITASTTEPVDEESEQVEETVLPSELPVAVEETPVAKSDDDNASQVSSDVTVEDVEEEEEEDDGYVHA